MTHRSEREGARQAGFTLLEVTFAAGLAVLVTLVGISLSTVGTDSLDLLTRSQTLDQGLKRALDRVSQDLLAASLETTVIDSSDANHDRVSFQMVDSDDLSGTPSFGLRDSDEVFRAGWSGEYRVESGSLVLRVFDEQDTVVEDRVLCANVDLAFDDGSGVTKGFAVGRVGELVTVTLRLNSVLRDQSDFRRQETTSVRQVNP